MSKICVVLVSDSLERLQMGAMVASVGAVSGREVLVFASMNALGFFTRKESATPAPEGPIGRLMGTRNVPPFKHLFQQAVEVGDARIFPCSMAMDVLALEQEDLEPWLQPATGLTKFLDDARDSQVWTF